MRFLILLQALGAKQIFQITRCNFSSLWNLPRGGVWPAELGKGKQTLLSMPGNNLGQEEQTRDRILQTCYPHFSHGQVLHLLGMKRGRIQTLISTICLSPSQMLTVPVFPFSLESSRSQSLLGRESQLKVHAHSWSSRLCIPQDTVLWAATSQPRPAWPV